MIQQQHLSHLGFKKNPFPVVPDARDFYLPDHLNKMIHELLHIIDARKGFAVVTGEVGLGKTTMSRVLLSMLKERQTSTALILNTIIQGEALLDDINKDFGLITTKQGLGDKLSTLKQHLVNCLHAGRNCAIVIDDAQNLSVESLEMLRQISNFETDSEKLVQILLIGQPELTTTLEQHALRQLKSRLAYQAEVRAYHAKETQCYIQFKLATCGSNGAIQISDSAIRMVHRLSKGVPRRINLLMDRYLYALVAHHCTQINGKTLRTIAQDSGLLVHLEEGSNRRHTRLLLTSMLCLLALTAFTFQNEIENTFDRLVQTDVFSTLQQTYFRQDQEKMHIVKKHQTKAPVSIQPLTSEHKAVAMQSKYDPKLVAFLHAYHMNQFIAVFTKAIELGMTHSDIEKLNALSPWKVIELSVVPKSLVHQHPVFTLTTLPTRHFLLWKPESSLDDFVVGVSSPGVLAIQKTLVQLDFHVGIPDGIIGIKTILGIVLFQRRYGLHPTGLLDLATLFLISNLQPPQLPQDNSRPNNYFPKQPLHQHNPLSNKAGMV